MEGIETLSPVSLASSADTGSPPPNALSRSARCRPGRQSSTPTSGCDDTPLRSSATAAHLHLRRKCRCRRLQQALARRIDLAEIPHLRRPHTCTCAASAGVSALQVRLVPSKRRNCDRRESRAAATRPRIAADGSPSRSSDSFSYSTRGTSTRSACRSGPAAGRRSASGSG